MALDQSFDIIMTEPTDFMLRRPIRKTCEYASIFAICLSLAACGGGGGSSSDDQGKLSLSITDAPIYDAQKVEVDFSGVEVKTADGPATTYVFCKAPGDPVEDPPIVKEGNCSTDPTIDPATDPVLVTIDLLEQTGGASYKLLDGIDLPAGRVNWVRLVLADPAGRLFLSTGMHELTLTVPSGNQTGLKLNRGFDVPEGGEISVYIDFDVRKSIVMAGANYRLKPTLRLVYVYGAIAGDVNAALVTADCLGPSIYVFDGIGTTPDDIDRDDGDPVTSAKVAQDTGTGIYSYRADFLAPGDYTVAFVCADGVLTAGGLPLSEPADDPDSDDAVNFTLAAPTSSATVVDGETQVIDF